MFRVNPDLIAAAHAALHHRRRLYWIIGGAAAGKSTICRAIAAQTAFAIYDMDERIYGGYQPHYTPERYPANSQWLAAANPLAWMLGLDPVAFDAFGCATTAEYLALLAADLHDRPLEQPLLIDGGITHPSLVVRVLDPRQIVCLSTPDDERVRQWETAEARAVMRDWIKLLPEPELMWRRFLEQDAQIAATLERESREAHIPVLVRRPGDSVDDMARRVLDELKIGA